MELSALLEVISNFGLPIALLVVLGWFIFKIYTDNKAQHKENLEQSQKNMEAVQARCKEREEKLYEEIRLNREVNAKAIETIAHYAEKLDLIQQDIHDIKNDITYLTAKTE